MLISSRRHGFTLVEILVVISIIAVLVSLTVAGIFQVAEGQRGANTETAMRMVSKVLQRQWKAVVDKADKETIPDNVIYKIAGGDMRRARVIWKKLRLKQEFPMTYLEAVFPHRNYANADALANSSDPTSAVLTANDLPSLYIRALTPPSPAKQPVGYVLFDPANPVPNREFIEASTCLVLSLKMSRGGVSLSPDDLGVHAQDVNGDDLKELVDGWGNPIAFFRWATASAELDNLNPASSGSTGKSFRDPLDPEGTLLTRGWNFGPVPPNPLPTGLPPGVNVFEQLCHTVHRSNFTSWSCYTTPVLASAGRNGKWGLATSAMMAPLNTDMTPDPATAADGDDNIYSFRLRGDMRGD